MNLRPVVALSLLPVRVAATGLRVLADLTRRAVSALDIPSAAAPSVQPEAHDPSPPARPPSSRPEQPPPPVDLPALVRRTAPEIMASVDTLSTSQLRELYDLETARRRRRRTVLQAIEQALTPPAGAATGEPPPADVRSPDELVHTTQTPTRR